MIAAGNTPSNIDNLCEYNQREQNVKCSQTKRLRKVGDEEQATIEKLNASIGAIETQINDNIKLYEECRYLMRIGVTSAIAVDQIKKMDGFIVELNRLKKERQSVIAKKDDHLLEFFRGDTRAILIEEVRNERANRAKYHPCTIEKLSEVDEVNVRLEQIWDAKKQKVNSANCPGHCANLTEDHQCCTLVCLDCGFVYEDKRCDQDNPMCNADKFGESTNPPKKKTGYKPLNHFIEIIKYFQGTRSTAAPPDVILKRIRDFCTRYRYESREITPQVVRSVLKRMQQEENNRHENALAKTPNDKLRRFTDFYRAAPEISYRLSGIRPPYMSPMQEERVASMFLLVVAAYKTSPRYLARLQGKVNCTKKLPNNLNYSFVFYKLCQLLGYDEFLPYISLPKSKDNIDDNDTQAWRHICEVNDWQYIPTI